MTAVEWLEEKAKEFAIDLDLLHYFEQAKEMEKKQAESIWKASAENMHRQFSSSAYKLITFEQYYNEKFNK